MDKPGLLTKTELALQYDKGYRFIAENARARKRIAELAFELATPAFGNHDHLTIPLTVQEEFKFNGSLIKACDYLFGKFRRHKFLFENYIKNDQAYLAFTRNPEFRKRLLEAMAAEKLSDLVGEYAAIMPKIKRVAKKLQKQYPDIDATNFIKFFIHERRYRRLIDDSIVR